MHYIGQVELEVVLPLGLPHPESEDDMIDTNMRNHFFVVVMLTMHPCIIL